MSCSRGFVELRLVTYSEGIQRIFCCPIVSGGGGVSGVQRRRTLWQKRICEWGFHSSRVLSSFDLIVAEGRLNLRQRLNGQASRIHEPSGQNTLSICDFLSFFRLTQAGGLACKAVLFNNLKPKSYSMLL